MHLMHMSICALCVVPSDRMYSREGSEVGGPQLQAGREGGGVQGRSLEGCVPGKQPNPLEPQELHCGVQAAGLHQCSCLLQP